LNSLLGQEIAISSKMPGKTQQIFYFGIESANSYFIDTPGYGFARIAAKEKDEFRKLMGKYLMNSHK